MLKLSISLPNNAQINLESEDAAVIDRILGIVLMDITRAILDMPPASGSGVQVDSSHRPPAPPAPAASTQPAVFEVPVAPDLRQTDQDTEQQPEQGNVPPVPSQADVLSQAPAAAKYDETVPDPEAPPVEMSVLEAQSTQPLINDWDAFDGFQVDGPKNALDGANGLPNLGGRHIVPSNLTPAVSEQAFVEFCKAANPLGDMRRVVVAAEGASRYLAMDGVDADALGRLFDVVGWPRAHNFVQTLRNAARSKFGWLERIPGRAGHYTVTDLGRATALGR